MDPHGTGGILQIWSRLSKKSARNSIFGALESLEVQVGAGFGIHPRMPWCQVAPAVKVLGIPEAWLGLAVKIMCRIVSRYILYNHCIVHCNVFSKINKFNIGIACNCDNQFSQGLPWRSIKTHLQERVTVTNPRYLSATENWARSAQGIGGCWRCWRCWMFDHFGPLDLTISWYLLWKFSSTGATWHRRLPGALHQGDLRFWRLSNVFLLQGNRIPPWPVLHVCVLTNRLQYKLWWNIMNGL